MSVDDLIRDRLEKLVEPLNDPDSVVTAIEARHRATDRRRTWPMLAAAAVVVAVAAIGGVAWLGGEPHHDVVAGPDTTSTETPPDAASATANVSVSGGQLEPLEVTTSELSPWTPGFARHELTFTNTGDTAVHVQDLRTGNLIAAADGEAPSLLVATERCGPGGGEGQPVILGCLHDYRPIGEIAPGTSVQVPLVLWSDLAGMVPLTDATYTFELRVQHRAEPFTHPAQTGSVGTVTVSYRNLTSIEQEPDAAPLRARLELPARSVRAGSALAGEVVVQNDTGEAVSVDGCGTPYAVALHGDGYAQETVLLQCLESFTLPPGESRWPVTIQASYSGCVWGEPTGTLPSCGPTDAPPDLLPGRYTATVTGRDGAPVPPAVDITVTPTS